MKMITINVSEPIYRAFQEYAQSHDRPTSELIREAMEEYRERKLAPRGSLADVRPSSVGRVLRAWSARDDLLGEMLSEDRP